ncbi:hypothetical protein T484DRAFT_1802877, partial [Baffinella frigidus]
VLRRYYPYDLHSNGSGAAWGTASTTTAGGADAGDNGAARVVIKAFERGSCGTDSKGAARVVEKAFERCEWGTVNKGAARVVEKAFERAFERCEWGTASPSAPGYSLLRAGAGLRAEDGGARAEIAYVQTAPMAALISALAEDLVLGRSPCVVGAKGSGKSAAIRHLALLLSHSIPHARPARTVHLYKVMSAHDLLIQRTTNRNGDTILRIS